MQLSKLVETVETVEVVGGVDTEITDLSYASQGVGQGSLFFCVSGEKSDGHDFAGDAVERGAAAVICERRLSLNVPQVVVANTRAAMAPIARRFFVDPTRTLCLVGVTGTNGKTTTTFLLRAILENCGYGCGLLGTIEQVVGGKTTVAERTTPEAVDLYRTFRRMIDSDDTACVIEVSSHALELHRSDGIAFDCAVFTNLTQDHLDFHSDMESYYQAKRRLFFPRTGPDPATCVVNIDDRWGSRLHDELIAAGRQVVSYGIEDEADFRARDFSNLYRSFAVDTPKGSVAIDSRLPGRFNVENQLAAIAAAANLNLSQDKVVEAVANFEQVPGRFELVVAEPFAVVVDYAHTPDSLRNVLEAARVLTSGKLITVFGCGGDRDRSKRPQMGEIAARLSDLTVVTSDNPRSEDPQTIISEIVAGIDDRDGAVEVEPDRRLAIERGLSLANPDDCVVVAGKGHEQGQEFENGRKLPFDDREIARGLLGKVLGGAGG